MKTVGMGLEETITVQGMMEAVMDVSRWRET